MRVLPRTVRGTWALAAAAWLAGCAAVWWALPVRPRAMCRVSPGDGLLTVFPDGRGGVTGREAGEMRWNYLIGPLRVWHAPTNQFASFLSEQDQVEFGETSPDGRWVAYHPRGDMRRLSLLDTTSGQTTLIAEGDQRSRVSFSPDSRWLAFAARCGDSDGIRLWDLSAGRPGHVLPDTGYTIMFSPDGRWLASLDESGPSRWTVCHIWDVTMGSQRGTVRKPDGGLLRRMVAFSADGACLIVYEDGLPFGRFSCREIDSGRERWGIAGVVEQAVTGGRLFWCLEGSKRSRDATLSALDIADGRVRNRLVINEPDDVRIVSPDGRILVTPDDRVDNPVLRWAEEHLISLLPGYSTERMKLLDLSSGQVMATLPAGSMIIFAPDGRTLAVLGNDNILRLWDIPPRKPLAWFLAAAGLLALPPAWLARRRARALRRRAEVIA
jgi:WD40 repeat protein